jgi:isopenicillin N synthase-like dioxygenase
MSSEVCERLSAEPARLLGWELYCLEHGTNMRGDVLDVSASGTPSSRAALVAALRTRGFALLRLAPEQRAEVGDYARHSRAFFAVQDAALKASAIALPAGSGVVASYLAAGDASARALSSTREYVSLTLPPPGRAAATGTPATQPEPEPKSVASAPQVPGGCEDFARAAVRMTKLCQGLADGLLAGIAAEMGVPCELLRSERGADTLAAFCYHPPRADADADGGSSDSGSGESTTAVTATMLPIHVDMNLLTLQLPSDVPGLQVLNVTPHENNDQDDDDHGEWLNVEALPLDYDMVLFAGAPLHRLTAGFIPACSHRVVAPPRCSMARGGAPSKRVSTVFKQKLADDAVLRTSEVLRCATAARPGSVSAVAGGRGGGGRWVAPAAAIMTLPGMGGGGDDIITDTTLRQMEVAAALHNLAQECPELSQAAAPPGEGSEQSLGGEQQLSTSLSRTVAVWRRRGEGLGLSVAADGTVLRYTGIGDGDGAGKRAGVPLGGCCLPPSLRPSPPQSPSHERMRGVRGCNPLMFEDADRCRLAHRRCERRPCQRPSSPEAAALHHYRQC